MNKITHFCSLIFLCTPLVGFSQSKIIEKAEVRKAWKKCVEAKESSKQHKTYLVSKNLDPKKNTKWFWVGKSEHLNAKADNIIISFDKNKNLLHALKTESSPSGDHYLKTEYCFRKDGSLAFIFRVFRTFNALVNGNPIRLREERRVWVGKKKTVDELTQAFNAQTGVELKLSEVNYPSPDSMGWKTTPKNLSNYTAKEFLSKLPPVKKK